MSVRMTCSFCQTVTRNSSPLFFNAKLHTFNGSIFNWKVNDISNYLYCIEIQVVSANCEIFFPLLNRLSLLQ